MAGTTHRIGRDHIHTYWSGSLPPAVTVQPGDTVVFETVDCNDGEVQRELDRLTGTHNALSDDLREAVCASVYPERGATDRDPSIRGGHPLTGPVVVDGAQVGDTLVVEILDIACAPWGWNSAHHREGQMGLLNDWMAEGGYTADQFHIWDLRQPGVAIFNERIRVPTGPFCGVIGVAPGAPGHHTTIPPRRVGGNMDVRHLTAGSTLYLPIEAEGARFSLGDVHAAQGDGEVTGTGIEMDATVTVRLSLRRDTPELEAPQFHTTAAPLSIPGPYYVATGHQPELREAARQALRGVMDYMVAEQGLARHEAYQLASACVDLKISQIVDLPHYTVSAYLPLSIFGA